MKIKLFCYKSDNNTPTIKNINVEKLQGTNLYYKENQTDYSKEYEYYFCIEDSELLCCTIGINRYTTPEQVLDKYNDDIAKKLTLENVVETIKQKIKNHQWTSKLDALICETFNYTELAKQCLANRENILIERQKEDELKQQQEIAKRIEQEKLEQEQAKRDLEQAKQKALSGNYISNKEFESLCKEFNIALNISFVGWLRKNCASIKITKTDAEHIAHCLPYSVSYTYVKGHKSTSLFDYANKLAIAMNI